MEDIAHHLLKTEKAVDDLDAAIRSLHRGSPRKTKDSTAEIAPVHSNRKRAAAVSSISTTAALKKRSKHSCCAIWCNHNNSTCKLTRVPPIPPDILYYASVKDHQSWQAKMFKC